MKKISELEDQPIDHSLISHIVSWLVPLPTYLPTRDGETFTFWNSNAPLDGGERTVIRLISLDVKSEDFAQIGFLAQRGREIFGLAPGGSDDELDSILNGLDTRLQTFAEIAVFLNLQNRLREDNITTIRSHFDEALALIRQIQSAIYSIDQVPRPLVTTQSLPSVVPLSIHSLSGMEPVSRLSAYVIPTVLRANSHWYPLEPTDETESSQLIPTELVHRALNRQIFNGPFSVYSELINEAQVAALNVGLPRTAALAAASAGEVLLDEALRCVLWESKMTPEDAGHLFAQKRDFKPRITNQLPQYLGGTWRLKGNGVIARWFNDVYRLRHRTIHAGEWPSDSEVKQAISTTIELGSFLADRFADKIELFPRTTMFFLGRPGLERRGKWTEKLQSLSEDRNEPPWVEAFSRWRRATEIIRERIRTKQPFGGNLANASIVFWVHPTGAHKWVAYDSEAYATLEVEPGVLSGMSDADTDRVNQALRLAREGKLAEPFFQEFRKVKVSEEPAGDWVLPYRNLPMLNVMVDGSEQRFA